MSTVEIDGHRNEQEFVNMKVQNIDGTFVLDQGEL